MDWTYVWVTLILLGVAATYIIAYVFFRRMYYVIVEIEARLIQLRDMIEAQIPKDKSKTAGRARPGAGARPAQAAQPGQPRRDAQGGPTAGPGQSAYPG